MSIEITLERIATALEQLAKNKPTVETPYTESEKEQLAQRQYDKARDGGDEVALPEEPAIKPKKVETNLPFADAKELSAYVMTKYKLLGPVKGAQIQNVLAELGLKNVNDVKPEHYQAFHDKVEAL